MKRTAFFNVHNRLGAKIVPFAGFEMPIQYGGIIEEHMRVRRSAGLFDVSHMGEFEISGRDALALVQKVTTNDASRLHEGKVQYSAMCYPDGGIVDDLLVYRFRDHFMLVVNAANMKKDFEWIHSNKGGLDAVITDRSDEFSLLALQGPKSMLTLQKLTPVDLSAIPYYSFVRGNLAGIDMIISRTGYTGEMGFELYFDSSVAVSEKIWEAVTEAGTEHGIGPAGLGARDTLRLEMGFCLYGNDIDAGTNPLEAGLGWILKLDKGDFIGRGALAGIREKGPEKKLIGFVAGGERAFPRPGYEMRLGGITVGKVTSGTLSPVLEKGIGMGYLPPDAARIGNRIDILIRGKEVGAQVVKIPFIQK